MANNELSPNDDSNGMPKIRPEIIRMFADLPNSFEERYATLHKIDPDMMREIFIAADNYSHRDMKQKRAFAAGALFMYGLMQYEEQRQHFESLLPTTTTDDGDGEDQQLST